MGVVVSAFPDLIVGKSKLHRKGVFAGRHFNSGDQVAEFKGQLCRGEDLPEPYADDKWVQVGADVFMGPSGGPDDLINHSCDPACALIIGNGKAVLKAIRPIKPMMEITFDYSVTMRDDPWTMTCNCGYVGCRGTVGEYKAIWPEVRERYEWMKIVPEYVTAPPPAPK